MCVWGGGGAVSELSYAPSSHGDMGGGAYASAHVSILGSCECFRILCILGYYSDELVKNLLTYFMRAL